MGGLCRDGHIYRQIFEAHHIRIFADWHRTKKIKLSEILEYRIDANGILGLQRLFPQNLKTDVNLRKLYASKIFAVFGVFYNVYCRCGHKIRREIFHDGFDAAKNCKVFHYTLIVLSK